MPATITQRKGKAVKRNLDAKTVPCPKCGNPAGKECYVGKGAFYRTHKQRWDAFHAAMRAEGK